MNEYIERFLQDPDFYKLDKILDNKILLGEALSERDFIEVVYSPYHDKARTLYKRSLSSLSETTVRTLKEFPEKFLYLPPEHFINSTMSLGGRDWKMLPTKIRKKILTRLLSALNEVIASKHPSFDVDLGDFDDDEDDCRRSFLLGLKREISTEIIVKLSECCNLVLSNEFLHILKLLPYETFKKIVSRSAINCNRGNKKEFREDFNCLPLKHRQVLLRAVVAGQVKGFGPILSSQKVGKKFLDHNASVLVSNFKTYSIEDKWVVEEIFQAKSALFRQQLSRFALLLAIKFNDFSEYLSKEDLKKYSKHLKPTQKMAWAKLLLNPAIEDCPTLLEQVVKRYCDLNYRLSDLRSIKIPDTVISKLTTRQVVRLVEKGIDEKGNFCGLKCNPEVIAQKLSSIALTEPVYYQKEIAGKLSLAIDKYKNGESIYDKICEHLEISKQDSPYSLLYNEDRLEKIICKAVSANTSNKRHAYVLFIVSLLQRRKFSEDQAKYRNLLKQG